MVLPSQLEISGRRSPAWTSPWTPCPGAMFVSLACPSPAITGAGGGWRDNRKERTRGKPRAVTGRAGYRSAIDGRSPTRRTGEGQEEGQCRSGDGEGRIRQSHGGGQGDAQGQGAGCGRPQPGEAVSVGAVLASQGLPGLLGVTGAGRGQQLHRIDPGGLVQGNRGSPGGLAARESRSALRGCCSSSRLSHFLEAGEGIGKRFMPWREARKPIADFGWTVFFAAAVCGAIHFVIVTCW